MIWPTEPGWFTSFTRLDPTWNEREEMDECMAVWSNPKQQKHAWANSNSRQRAAKIAYNTKVIAMCLLKSAESWDREARAQREKHK